MGARRTPEETEPILMFGLVFFGTLSWLGSVVDVAVHHQGWWYSHAQAALALPGIVMFWMAWWLDSRGRHRQALSFLVPAVAVLSIWLTAVHSAL